ncbi:MAG: hypothetical protein JST12_00540 [Armatimonadetes bacterium]|nr:hypothetical protein [Armatimonadota bacterium]
MTALIAFLTTACLTQSSGIDPKGFKPGLQQPAFQDYSWITVILDRKDVSLAENYQQVLKRFIGHRHDQALLQEYRNAFQRKPSQTTAFEESCAVICFLGLPFGERASYLNSGKSLYFGQHEYWDLANHWPEKPCPLQYWARATMFTIIGGNIKSRLNAIEHYLKFFPEADDFQRMDISVKLIMNPLYRKLRDNEWQSLAQQAKSLYERNRSTNYLLCYYGAQCALATHTNKKVDHQLAIALGEKLVSACSGNEYDMQDVPSIQRNLSKRRETVSKMGQQ